MKPTIRLNVKRLAVNKKGYAEVLFFSDLHLGHPQCHLKKATEMLKYCLENNIYVVFLGDMMESGLTSSVGDSVYHQKLNPQEQMEAVIELIKPLAQKNLVLGYLLGNHEQRIRKTTGIDVSKNICRELGISYLGYACWNLWYVGNQSYTLYLWHGSSGSKFIYTKLKSAVDVSHYFIADLIAVAHMHSLTSDSIERQFVDKATKTIKIKKAHILITGHYLGFDDSYAQEKGYPPSKIGSPKVKFFSDKFDLHISF
mgnify:CR=1 FL=1